MTTTMTTKMKNKTTDYDRWEIHKRALGMLFLSLSLSVCLSVSRRFYLSTEMCRLCLGASIHLGGRITCAAA